MNEYGLNFIKVQFCRLKKNLRTDLAAIGVLGVVFEDSGAKMTKYFVMNALFYSCSETS